MSNQIDLKFYNHLYQQIETFILKESKKIISTYSKNTGQRNYPIVGTIKYNRFKDEFWTTVEISWYAKKFANPLEEFKRCVIKGIVICNREGNNFRFEVVYQNKHALDCKDSHWANGLYRVPFIGPIFTRLKK